MGVTWDEYLQAADLDEISIAAQKLQELAGLEDSQGLEADLMVASRLYVIRGELEYGSNESAWYLMQSLITEHELLPACSPAWLSRVHQWYGNVLGRYGEHAAAALSFEKAAETREYGYSGSAMAPYLFNSASSSALLAGASEWAYELALRSLNHMEKYPAVLDMEDGPRHRKEAVRCLSRSKLTVD